MKRLQLPSILALLIVSGCLPARSGVYKEIIPPIANAVRRATTNPVVVATADSTPAGQITLAVLGVLASFLAGGAHEKHRTRKNKLDTAVKSALEAPRPGRVPPLPNPGDRAKAA